MSDTRLADIEAWLLSRLGPAHAACAMRIGADDHSLFPEEARCVATAVSGRRQEFAAGRACARAALAALGAGCVPVPMGPLREPIWPCGYIGSIAHDDGVAVAVAGATPSARVGVDLISLRHAWPEQGDTLVVSSSEELRFARAAEVPHPVGLLLFSIKESAIKALSAEAGRLIGFTELRVKIEEHFFAADQDLRCEWTVHGSWGVVGDILLSVATAHRREAAEHAIGAWPRVPLGR